MSTRFLAIAYTVLAVGLVGVVPGAAGQTDTSGSSDWTVPRAPDGHPDLQGVWPNNGATPLERPEVLGDRAYLTEEEVATLQARASELFNGETDAAFGGSVFETVLQDANDYQSGDGVTTETPDGTGNYNQFWLVDREFDNRTSLIVDPPNGRLPARTAGAVQLAEAERALRRAHPADSYSDRNVDDRCISYGVPRTSAGYNSYFQILQTPTHVAILQEMIHEVRLIPLMEQPHLPTQIRQYTGDSRARWEGDSLVVETTNFSPKSDVRGSTERIKTVERFTRVAPDRLNWEVTFTDADTWTTPWTLMIRLAKSDEAIFEYACHEGNYSMAGILSRPSRRGTCRGGHRERVTIEGARAVGGTTVTLQGFLGQAVEAPIRQRAIVKSADQLCGPHTRTNWP